MQPKLFCRWFYRPRNKNAHSNHLGFETDRRSRKGVETTRQKCLIEFECRSRKLLELNDVVYFSDKLEIYNEWLAAAVAIKAREPTLKIG